MSDYIKHNRSTSKANALIGNEDTIFFSNDTHEIIMGGQVYGSKLIEPFYNLNDPTVRPSTVADVKTTLATLWSDVKRGVGANVTVPSIAISKWNDDSAAITANSVYSMIKIGGGYEGSEYGQWMLSSHDTANIGYVGRSNNLWSNIKWLLHSDLLKTGFTKSGRASNDITYTLNRQYAVGLDSNGLLSVNVPWVDASLKTYSLSLEDSSTYPNNMPSTEFNTVYNYTGSSIWPDDNNVPEKSLGRVFQFPSHNGYLVGQLFWSIIGGGNTATTKNLYWRVGNPATTTDSVNAWQNSEWKQIAFTDYVDEKIETFTPDLTGYVQKSGDTMTGGLNFNLSEKAALLSILNTPLLEFDFNNGGIYLGTTANTPVIVNTIEASAFYEVSDLRKKDIKSDLSLDKCYDLIDKCQTVIYSLKDQTKEQVGLIAQEIEEFFPEVVATDNGGFKSLDYSRLVVICFKVLKDVIKRLEKLEHE